MRVANSLKHLSLSHIWWRSSVETCGGRDQQVWGCSQPDSKTQADPSTTSLTFPWSAAVSQSIPDRSKRLDPWFKEDFIDPTEDFLHDGCGKAKAGRGSGERSAVWTVCGIIVIIIHSSSVSIRSCNHVFDALLHERNAANKAFQHFSGLTKTPDGYSELSLWPRRV